MVEALRDILPDDVEYVGEKWGAVYFSERGIHSPNYAEIEMALEKRGFDAKVVPDNTSPYTRVEKL